MDERALANAASAAMARRALRVIRFVKIPAGRGVAPRVFALEDNLENRIPILPDFLIPLLINMVESAPGYYCSDAHWQVKRRYERPIFVAGRNILEQFIA
jgi:hypothetical protein